MRWMLVFALLTAQWAFADETCMSPYMAKIKGQEDFVYVWTLGVEGVGDEQGAFAVLRGTQHGLQPCG